MVLSGGRKHRTWRSTDPHFVVPLHMTDPEKDGNDDEVVLNLRVSFRALLLVGIIIHVIAVPGGILLDRFL
ncbi:hypothetical protein QIP59_gp3 [ssRNA phage Zoerhiza.1_2]|uniref:Uncharacterized protein n=2 Tax=Leviviricetes TaxID=2842243 RepID=A0A8S5L263_9VIRU|nr:hypothetical protein QIP59_gp3 [ssRNA phage Zoerhiza.1_2]QDH88734.1 MAG: hypothetical protein H1Rhizo25414_000002 [Leviviridae sp.]DAD51503.1 TPA_asm: hypothetical protein [ssRNA phage Zoerhiza.1_2]